MEETFCNSPLGTLALTADKTGLTSVRFASEATPEQIQPAEHPLLEEAVDQLRAYFDGRLTAFDLPLSLTGTAFQKSVWEELLNIPYGCTTTYLDLSKKLGDRNAIRAVGKANGQNPIAVIVPCHRVIGANNNLIGYAGGIERKRRLLQHEGALLL